MEPHPVARRAQRVANIIANVKERVLISGASIAGPALAYWLDRYGYAVTVVERSPGLRSGGYGVDVRGAAIDVARLMGVLDEVKAADTRIDGVDFVDASGHVAARLHEAAVGNRPGVDLEVMRGDLSLILYNLTKETVTYLWDESITAIKEHESGLDVQFGHHVDATFDMVIGADGQHSNVRALTFGDESQFASYLGFYIAKFTLDNYLHIDHRQLIYSLPGKTVGMYSARNNTEAKALFLFQSPPLQYDYHDLAAQKKMLRDTFQDERTWQIPRLLEEMATAQDLYFDSVSQIQMPTWSKGRVALVGDAAAGPSPSSGQGTSVALVGAYVLAGELQAAQGDYGRAFVNYEREMRPFATASQKRGQSTAKSLVVDSMAKVWLRNQILRRPRLMRFLFQLSTQSMTRTATRITLKNYAT
jgi:2-polyprenyl-6-methoxyphenol hydroxylase-like FAD-dependent oxidoreductase